MASIKIMRVILLLLLYSVTTTVLCQTGGIKSLVQNVETGEAVPLCSVAIYRDGVLIMGDESNLDGSYSFQGLTPGDHSIEVFRINAISERIQTTVVADSTITVELDLKVCDNYIEPPRVCPRGHTNRISDIYYGLVLESKKLSRQSRRGKVILAGCEVPPCPDYYYCRKHKVRW